MKNRINTDQFHINTGFLGNRRRNLISTFVNTEIGSHKYENGRTKIKKQNGSEREYFRPFSTLGRLQHVGADLEPRLATIVSYVGGAAFPSPQTVLSVSTCQVYSPFCFTRKVPQIILIEKGLQLCINHWEFLVVV